MPTFLSLHTIWSFPFWQTLPPNEITGALAQLPDGTSMPSAVALKGLKNGDQALSEALWKYTETGGAAALAAVKAGTILGVADLADRLLPLLQSADRQVRQAAIEGLKGKDTPNVNAGLRKVVDDDPESDLRDLTCILAVSSDAGFAATAQYHALKSKDANIVLKAANALGSSKQKEAKDRLLSIISHDDSRVREAAMKSLLKRGDIDALVTQLNTSKLEKSIAIELARLLSDQKKTSARKDALIFLALNGDGDDSKSSVTGPQPHSRAPVLSNPLERRSSIRRLIRASRQQTRWAN